MPRHTFQPSLGSLVWPNDAREFLQDHWQQKPLFVRGSPERLGDLSRIYFDFDLLEILRRANLKETKILFRRPPKVFPKRTDDIGTLLALYDAGVQLYIATSGMDGVREWLDALTTDLGTIWSRARGDIYATKRGGGIELHFDSNHNFTIQLRGRKQWEYSRQEHYENPLHNFSSDEPQRLPYDPTYRPTVPRRALRDLEKVVLRPGDMLYVPPGFWHRTEALDDAVSFNISINPMSWSEVLTDAMQVLLMQSPQWRATAMRDHTACAERLAELGRMLQDLRPEDLLRSAATPPASQSVSDLSIEETTWLRRNPLVWWYTPTPERGDTVRVELVYPDRTIKTLVLATIFLSLLRKLPTDGRPFQAISLLSRWRHERRDGLELLRALTATGLLSVTSRA